MPAVDGFDGIVEFRIPGHQETHGLWRFQMDPFEQLNAAAARHFLVGENNVDAAFVKDFFRGVAGVGGGDVVKRRQ